MRTSLLASLLLTVLGAEAAVRVESFSPTGSVADVRQVTARFSEAIVALGDPRLPDPFEVDCVAAGHGRWLDGRHWVYDFDQRVPSGVACRFSVTDSLAAADGAEVEAARFAFDTGGPRIRASLPREGDERIDEAALFTLALDGAVDPESVLAHANCEVSGIGERIPVEIVDGEQRRAALLAQRALGYAYARLLAAGSEGRVEPLAPEAAERAEADLLLLRCRRVLPPGTEVHLVWGAGIAAPSGLATSVDQTLVFRTRPEFTARFECRRVNARADCLPGSTMRLVFSAPVARTAAEATRLIGAHDSMAPNVEDGDWVDAVTFPGPFPEHATYRIDVPADLVDDAERPLTNASRFPLEVTTDSYPPLARFAGEFGILESREGAVLPVTLRNLEADVAARLIPGARRRIDDDVQILHWLDRVREAMAPRGEWLREGDAALRWQERTGSTPVLADSDGAEALSVPRSGAEFEVVGIPLGGPGFYVVELASPRLGAALLGEDRPRYVATTALVTNLAVHLQWGRESSLVWVTSLDAGTPVAGADVRITDACNASLLWRGVTNDDGMVRVLSADDGSPLPAPHENSGCHDWHPSPLFVSARQGGELGFTMSSWTEGISPSSFGLPMGTWSGPEIVHTVLDRTLLRAGETVSMKHFVRRHTSSGFAVPEGFEAATLEITHDGTGQRWTSELRFDDAGIAESAWSIPANAKLGRYVLRVDVGEGRNARSFWPGEFRVEQYRVPTMRAVIQPPTTPLVNADTADVDLFLEYLSGGGAGGAPVRIRTLVTPRTIVHREYEDFTFGGDPVVEGSTRDRSGAWYFPEGASTEAIAPARVVPLVLDASGAARYTIADLPTITVPHDLQVDFEFADANGEISTVARRIPLWPAAVQVGIKTEGWVASADRVRFRVLVVDLDGDPASDRDVEVEVFSRRTSSHRQRLVGGYYAYENRTEVTRLDVRCVGETDDAGLLVCELEPGVSGAVVLQASVADAAGNRAIATREMWLAGEDEWWFGAAEGDRMDVLPEAPRYESGDVARLQVRMPFRSATALVTVAREGVLDSFVVGLSGREPVIEVPISARHAPNVYVSVLAVRGRVGTFQSWLADLLRDWDLPWRIDGGAPTALLDLSKPAYKLGFARLDVGFAPHRLDVTVDADRDAYGVRETARVRVQVARADGGELPEDAEIALAAVDEGLLELASNPSWQLLDAMMDRRGIEVITSTAQMQVVGKRHYGRKAVAQGGGGGHEPARELFDTLLLWKGRVPLDPEGVAGIEVPLVDTLTAYRLVAVANAGTDLFGTGSTAIRTTQDLILHSGAPPLVREGDRFAAVFTLRNASQSLLEASVAASVAATTITTELPTQAVTLRPGEARPVTWEYTVPSGVDRLTWNVSARAAGVKEDRLHLDLQVAPLVPVRVVQATLTQLDGPYSVSVAPPDGALAGRGGVEVGLASRLGDGFGALRAYMNGYPYGCFEQRASSAVALRDVGRWDALMAGLSAYLDRDGLLRFFPSDRLPGEDVLTAYILSLASEAGWPVPDAERERMLAALTGFVEGRLLRESALTTADLTVRKLAAIAALARHGRAQARLLGSIAIDPPQWPTSALLDWLDILQRVEAVPDRAARRRQAERLLRTRMSVQGTTITLSAGDALWWLMRSADLDAVRAVSTLSAEPAWQADLPRLARGALGRMQHGRWDITPANAWGVLAFEKFSERFEREPTAGTTRARLAATDHAFEWPLVAPADAFAWPWPKGADRLELVHRGTGRPWAFVTARAALPLKAPLSAGYGISRTVTPIAQARPGVWSRGDIAEVQITIDAAADMTWVVLDDPVPAGATILGTGLGRDSSMLAGSEPTQRGAWPAFVERRFEAYRAYYRYLPRGRVEIRYRFRLNNAGHFELPATRVEAMYAPEMFGEVPNASMVVQATP